MKCALGLHDMKCLCHNNILHKTSFFLANTAYWRHFVIFWLHVVTQGTILVTYICQLSQIYKMSLLYRDRYWFSFDIHLNICLFWNLFKLNTIHYYCNCLDSVNYDCNRVSYHLHDIEVNYSAILDCDESCPTNEKV